MSRFVSRNRAYFTEYLLTILDIFWSVLLLAISSITSWRVKCQRPRSALPRAETKYRWGKVCLSFGFIRFVDISLMTGSQMTKFDGMIDVRLTCRSILTGLVASCLGTTFHIGSIPDRLTESTLSNVSCLVKNFDGCSFPFQQNSIVHAAS